MKDSNSKIEAELQIEQLKTRHLEAENEQLKDEKTLLLNQIKNQND